MSLVAYPESDDDGDIVEKDEVISDTLRATSLKRKTEPDTVNVRRIKPNPPPSLPSDFHTLYATNVRTSTNDDPSLHGGRQRQIPHVVGNWPSFIYLEWIPSERDLAKLEVVLKVAVTQHNEPNSTDSKIKINSFLRSDLGVRLPLHVSMSSPLILSTENKGAFEESLIKVVGEANIPPFSATVSGLKWVSNFDKTRNFLILTLDQSKNDNLNKLLKLCNQVCRSFDLPQLYTESRLVGVSRSVHADESSPQHARAFAPSDDKFHISIAWKLQHFPAENYETPPDSMVTDLQIGFNQLLVKIGNNVSKMSLGDVT